MITNIPLLPMPYWAAKGIIHGFYPLGSVVAKFFPGLENELAGAKSKIDAREYASGALLAFALYLIAIGGILAIFVYRNNLASSLQARLAVVFIAGAISLAIFTYIMAFPRWLMSKNKAELEKNLLFAARHLMVQTSAGVPLFESIVSVSYDFEQEDMGYGAIGEEFRKIVKEVRSGKELSLALEESALKNPSTYYRRIVWQLANANKSGANMGFVLKQVVEFLSDEQRILVKEYGSQLNPLALFYMLVCIVAPTMGLIFIAIASTIANLPVSEALFGAILVLLVVAQIMFIGLIKSRRPTVAL